MIAAEGGYHAAPRSSQAGRRIDDKMHFHSACVWRVPTILAVTAALAVGAPA